MKIFGSGPKGAVLSMTRAEHHAAASQAAAGDAAALKLKLVPGAPVHGVAGNIAVGNVKAVEDQFVIVTTPKGDTWPKQDGQHSEVHDDRRTIG